MGRVGYEKGIMSYSVIDGQLLKAMYLGGTALLKTNASMINDLNVFPVPDGDTGLNMTKTLEGGIEHIISCQDTNASVVADRFTHGALFGARGNSGVILSQILKGIKIGIGTLSKISVLDMIKAFECGVETAYKAVEKPVEGTILTVVREATEYISKSVDNITSFEELLRLHLEQAKKTLAKTKEMLPMLKEADVIDSGGAGYVCFVEGMYRALIGEEIAVTEDFESETKDKADYSLFTSDSTLLYGYCTEFILRLQNSKVNVETFDENIIIDYLKGVGGDSIVCYKDGDIVKVHVHTFKPGDIINECQKYGEYLTMKIENMTLQHSEKEASNTPKKKNGIVAVVNGEGLINLFNELGCDAIINGGQTGNPSSEDFLQAFEKVNAENIVVLPNNSNIYLAAEQAGELYKKANVIVLKTKSIQQGYVALSVFDSDTNDLDMLIGDMCATIEGVVSVETTYACRDAQINGITIKKDEFMTFIDGKLACCDVDEITSTIKALSLVEDIDLKEMLTVFIGENVSEEERQLFIEQMEENYPDISVTMFDGGQKVYRFLLGIE